KKAWNQGARAVTKLTQVGDIWHTCQNPLNRPRTWVCSGDRFPVRHPDTHPSRMKKLMPRFVNACSCQAVSYSRAQFLLLY
ncbi:MAG: hypothetical protein J0I90_08285, partial [Nitrosospira sp.]|nr:hypothetical protein [Nitrosospira sp.]